MPQTSAAGPVLVVVRVLFVLAVAVWHSALPWAIERQEVGAPLGPVAVLARDAGAEQILGRLVSRVRWVTGGGIYVATVDQNTASLMNIEVEPLSGGYQLASYLLLFGAAGLLLHLIAGLLVRPKTRRYR